MRAVKFRMAAAALSLAVAAPATASELGSSSSATMQITVIIPPLGAAFAAQQQGAVGIWTINGAADGLMLDLPTEIAATGEQSFSLYSRNTSTLYATPLAGGAAVTRADSSVDRGLGRQSFVLRRDAGIPAQRSMTVLIGSL